MKYKNGFSFKVAKNGFTGVIDGVSSKGIYSVCFFDETGAMYLRADVYESTITGNLECGAYVAR